MLKEQTISLRDLHESLGTKKLYFKICELLESKDDKPPELRPDDFNLKEIFEAVGVTAFPTIAGAVIHQKIIDAYNATPTIGDKLCHKVTSKRRKEDIVGFVALEKPKEVKELMPYEESSLAEKGVQIKNHKYGRTLAISEEAVMEDQTGQILQVAASLGNKAAVFKEKIIFNAVRDANSTSYNNGVLYRTDADYGNFDSTAFNTDGSGLKAVKLLLTDMVDEEGDPILIGERILLVPEELSKNAHDLVNPRLADSTYFKGWISEVLTSPFMTEAAEYYYGDFKTQFRYQEVWPIQVLMAKQGNEDEFNRDVFAKYKVRLYGGCGAIDYRYVIRSEG